MVPFSIVVFQLVDRVDEATSKQGVQHGIRFCFYASSLTVVSWLTYPFVLSRHLSMHEYVGQLLVDAEDWTSKGAVMQVKNQGQFDS